MSALAKLHGLMMGLKAMEHDRWDTAAHAVLELAHKIGLGHGAQTSEAAPTVFGLDPRDAKIAGLEQDVADLHQDLTRLARIVSRMTADTGLADKVAAEAKQAGEQAPAAPADPQPAPPAEPDAPIAIATQMSDADAAAAVEQQKAAEAPASAQA